MNDATDTPPPPDGRSDYEQLRREAWHLEKAAVQAASGERPQMAATHLEAAADVYDRLASLGASLGDDMTEDPAREAAGEHRERVGEIRHLLESKGAALGHRAACDIALGVDAAPEGSTQLYTIRDEEGPTP